MDAFSCLPVFCVVFPVNKFDFQRPEKSHHRCVVIAIAFPTPTGSDSMFAKRTLEVTTAVLATAVTGKDQPFRWLANRHFHRVDDQAAVDPATE